MVQGTGNDNALKAPLGGVDFVQINHGVNLWRIMPQPLKLLCA